MTVKGDTPMVVEPTVRDERAIRADAASRPNRSLCAPAAGTSLCPHCGYNPASPRIFGFCSWDCHDEDEEEESDVA
jgi:hypothetical protein